MDKEKVEEIQEIYDDVREMIEERIAEFQELWDRKDEELFDELVFCLFTPQSKAKACWGAVEELKEDGTLEEGSQEEIAERINRVRFRNNKAGYLVEVREKFGDDVARLKEKLSSFDDSRKAREWVVDNIKGLGYKEASHFLRNIGYAQDLAILDRHILRNLIELGVIDEEPKTLTKKRYLEIEEKMKDFSDEIGIPIHHLDLLLWYKETGEVFK